MHEIVELGRDVVQLEKGSAAGIANVFGQVLMFSIVVGGGAWRVLCELLDRGQYGLERYWEYRSGRQGRPFVAKEPPKRESRVVYALMFLVLAIACPISLSAIGA